MRKEPASFTDSVDVPAVHNIQEADIIADIRGIFPLANSFFSSEESNSSFCFILIAHVCWRVYDLASITLYSLSLFELVLA